jgi:hypothetical protein
VLDVDSHGRAKLAVSRIHSRLLEARNMPGWKKYLRDIFTISRALAILGREVQDIKMSLLVSISSSVASIFFSLTTYMNFNLLGPHRSCRPTQTHRGHTRGPEDWGRCTAASLFPYVSLDQFYLPLKHYSVRARVRGQPTAPDYEV